MKAIWRKDLPWMLVLIVAGSLGLGLAIAERGWIQLYVIGPHRLDTTFNAAAGAGLLLGALAILWDDLLGTREFLTQRPLSRRALARCPIQACITVLISWMILAPVLGWIFAALSSDFEITWSWVGQPEILATLMIAWPMAAIGSLAAALPSPWWIRFLTAGALSVTVGTGLISLSNTTGGLNEMGLFSGLCVLTALLLFAATWYVTQFPRDPDRPWAIRTRFVAGTSILLAMGFTVAGLAGDAQRLVVRSLHREYPDLVRRKAGVSLALRDTDWKRWILCNPDHTRIGESIPYSHTTGIWYRLLPVFGGFDLEAPRWQGSVTYEQRRVDKGYTASILLDRRGRALLLFYRDHKVESTGQSSKRLPFPEGSRLEQITDLKTGDRHVLVVGHSESGQIWRFDSKLGYFVDLELPQGASFRRFESIKNRLLRPESGTLPAISPPDGYTTLVQGQTHSYARKGQEWVSFEPTAVERATDNKLVAEVLVNDPLEYTVQVRNAQGQTLFEHHYRPRTWLEKLNATHAMFWSVIRPPLLQTTGSVLANDESRSSLFVDRLLAGGKRPWLLTLGWILSALLAFATLRRFQRRGVDAGARRFWVVAILLTGPIAAFLALACEPARAHARRDAVPVPPPPKILTGPVLSSLEAIRTGAPHTDPGRSPG